MRLPLLVLALTGPLVQPLCAAGPGAPEFAAIYRILDQRCVECHGADDPEGGLALETHAQLLKGGETGPALIAGKGSESLLVKYLRGEAEKGGKKRVMPPGKREKLSAEEIELFVKWIDAGAPAGQLTEMPRQLTVPKVAPQRAPRLAVNSLAYAPQQKLLAVGRYGTVELLHAETRQRVRLLEGLPGNVNALAFSPDGESLFAATGENAVYGEVRQWRTADGQLQRTFRGHRDTLYALALSPDGKVLATGSYDQQIKLWDTATGAELRTLRGHNGAIFDLAFRPDGQLLASASADRTIKLWEVSTGQRRDTFSQPLKEQTALVWSPNGQRLAGAGFDNRIRLWGVSAEGKETTNTLEVARFAHEGAIARLARSTDGAYFSSAAQDGTVKIWDAATMKERLVLEKQPDWPAALTFAGQVLVAGRLDGSLGFYDAASGQPVAAKPVPKPAPPELARAEPAALQHGTEVRLKLTGKNLAGLRKVASSHAALTATLQPGATATEASVVVQAGAAVPRGSYTLVGESEGGQKSAPLKVWIDDLPVVTEAAVQGRLLALPATVSGVLSVPGETDRYTFQAQPGQTLVFDVAAKSADSKANAVLTLTDADGKVLASSNDYDGAGDPLLHYTFTQAGTYTLRVNDLEFLGSAEHTYRVCSGSLHCVWSCSPLSVPVGAEAPVKLVGYNLPTDSQVTVKASQAGELPLPLDQAKYRTRRVPMLTARDIPVIAEAEPNDTPAQATELAAPTSANGRFWRGGEGADVDYYRFTAAQGSTWVIETVAAQRLLPADTKIEVLDDTGKPIERLQLQAVRDSAINFRAIDSVINDVRVDNWREMELNQYLYFNGDVAKIFRMPEGPDSGFQLYKLGGKRRAYFHTTATAHAVDEPCYVVEPHAPGEKLISTGLPVFPLYFVNDDDGDRAIGTDSRLLFTAPRTGAYVVRVTDTRGFSGERYGYELLVRQPKPGFSVSLAMANRTVDAGSGQPFTVRAARRDGFEGEIHVELSGLPPGWKVTSPLVIQAGHEEARGCIQALESARSLTEQEVNATKVVARAEVEGRRLEQAVGSIGKLTLGGKPGVVVALEPAAPGDTVQRLSPATPRQQQNPSKPYEIVIAPGESIPAWVKITRHGNTVDIRFDVENLPHGIIVDNLGLNGITLLANQNEGEIALRADPWVQEMDRLCFAVTRGNGTQASLPILLKVRKKPGVSMARQ